MNLKFFKQEFNTTTALYAIIIASLTFHFTIFLLGKTLLVNWRWVALNIHTAIEIGGSIVAIFVATFLFYYERFGRGTHYNIRIATALMAMGIIDGFHAISPLGNTFVWLHSLATFIGGLLIVLIYIPRKWFISKQRQWPLSMILISCLICVISVLFPENIPAMTFEGQFTQIAVLINLLGGVFFAVAAIKLYVTFQKFRSIDDLLFCLHCFLFGAASIMFELSSLWDAPWWGWHFLRFMAYIVALWFIVRLETNVLVELDNHLISLERAVEKRTTQLQQANNNLQTVLHNMEETQKKLEEKEKQTALAQLETKQTLDDLILAKDSLVQSEKMASLGLLVSGVAHEINTPIGICVTSNSLIKEETITLLKALESNGLSKSQLSKGLGLLLKCEGIIETGLNRAAGLIKRFRSVAVEQGIDTKQNINLSKHFNEILSMLKISLKNKSYHIKIIVDEKLTLTTYPSVWNEILTNLIMNSHIHGFEDRQEGDVLIVISENNNNLVLDYKDNGKGINQDIKNQIFDPFVTTKRGQGNSGLGLHIVFNLVNTKLEGTIKCIDSEFGSHFQIKVPIV